MARSVCAFSRLREAVLLLAALFALLAVEVAHAVPPKYFELTSPSLAVSSGSIIAKADISVDNLRGLFDMLKDGAAIELKVKATFVRERTLWANVAISEKELVYVLRHNPLTREFAMFVPGRPQPMLDKNLNRLLKATWSKFQVDFGPLSMLEKQEDPVRYKAVLVMTLQHAEVPPWLAKQFVLWSKNIVEPETVTLPFSY